jgi:hypothetical protein
VCRGNSRESFLFCPFCEAPRIGGNPQCLLSGFLKSGHGFHGFCGGKRNKVKGYAHGVGDEIVKRWKGLQAFQLAADARQVSPENEIRRVVEKPVVLIGLHVLSLDKLIRCVWPEAMAGPPQLFEIKRLEHGPKKRKGVWIPFHVGLKLEGHLPLHVPQLVRIIHDLLYARAGEVCGQKSP